MNISARHAHWFRFRGSGLAEPFATPAVTARRLIGVQAQLPVAADIAFFNRTVGVSPDSLARERYEKRTVVRMWGQRDTAHVYAADDWPLLYMALRARESCGTQKLGPLGLELLAERPKGSKLEGLRTEFRRVVRRMAKRLAAGERLTYKDAASKKLEAVHEPSIARALVFRQVVREGIACHGPDQGGGSTFVHRSLWLPELDWALPEEDTACGELACRYFGAYGPAAPRDLAYWFGTSVTTAQLWVTAAADRLVDVAVDGQPALCPATSLKAVVARPPAPSRWPVKLLGRFDPLLLGTKDKDWLIEPQHRKRVWRPGAHIEAVILVGGRIVGTWRYDKKAKGLVITVTPFTPLSRAVARAVEIQARAVAAFMGLDLLELR